MTEHEGIRCVVYLNQFFGGVGGEEAAMQSPYREDGPVGPARLLDRSLGDAGGVVSTVVCGDDFFAENEEAALAEVQRLVLEANPDLVIAGPAFGSGRYGWACAKVASSLQRTGILAVTGMHEENPGLELMSRDLYVVPTSASAATMKDAIGRMLELVHKLRAKELIGGARDNGYFPRGVRKNQLVEEGAADRLVRQLLRKVAGESFETEIALPNYDNVPPSRLSVPLSEARVALLTEGGLVPTGNPDRLPSARSTQWFRYSIAGVSDLEPDAYELMHGTFDKSQSYGDPDRVLPVDVMRDLERDGVVGGLHDDYYVTSGFAMALKHAERIGREIGSHMRDQNIMAVIVTST